jgi:hypothetical protein
MSVPSEQKPTDNNSSSLDPTAWLGNIEPHHIETVVGSCAFKTATNVVIGEKNSVPHKKHRLPDFVSYY